MESGLLDSNKRPFSDLKLNILQQTNKTMQKDPDSWNMHFPTKPIYKTA